MLGGVETRAAVAGRESIRKEYKKRIKTLVRMQRRVMTSRSLSTRDQVNLRSQSFKWREFTTKSTALKDE